MSLSVVVRTRNEADRLRLTLASLAAQGVPSEIIVVNDGSSDHTYEVVEEAVRNSGVRAIHHNASRGRSGAANAGARAAKTTYSCFSMGTRWRIPISFDGIRRRMAAVRDR
jgi:glycosyltransferase involved in cell wall biosynthesis